MGRKTTKADRIGMEVEFEAVAMHISNCLPAVRDTHGI